MPKAQIGNGPNPEAWFPWNGKGMPKLYYEDVIRCLLRNGVYTNEMRAVDRGEEYYNATGDWGVIAIGVFLSNFNTIRRMEELTGHYVDNDEAIQALMNAVKWYEKEAVEFSPTKELNLRWAKERKVQANYYEWRKTL